MTRSLRHLRCFALLAVLLAGVTSAHADAPYLDTVADQYKAAADRWSTLFFRYANGLFWLLAAIDFAWTGIRLALRGADIQEFVSDLVREILLIGFFFALLANGTTWIPAIIESFRQIGSAANEAAGATATYRPSSILNIALEVATRLIESSHFYDYLFVGLVGLTIIVTAAWISAEMIIAICEMHLVCTIGLVLLGFGGSRWTRDYPRRILTYAVSVGVKLMLIQLLVGIGQIFILQFAHENSLLSEDKFSFQAVIPIGISLLVLLALVRSLPGTVQSIINGITTGAHASFSPGAFAQAVAGASSLATAATPAGTAVSAAARLAKAAGSAAAATGSSSVGRLLQAGIGLSSRTAGNFAASAARDLKSTLRGENPAAGLGRRMTRDLFPHGEKPKPDPAGTMGALHPGGPSPAAAGASGPHAASGATTDPAAPRAGLPTPPAAADSTPRFP